MLSWVKPLTTTLLKVQARFNLNKSEFFLNKLQRSKAQRTDFTKLSSNRENRAELEKSSKVEAWEWIFGLWKWTQQRMNTLTFCGISPPESSISTKEAGFLKETHTFVWFSEEEKRKMPQYRDGCHVVQNTLPQLVADSIKYLWKEAVNSIKGWSVIHNGWGFCLDRDERPTAVPSGRWRNFFFHQFPEDLKRRARRQQRHLPLPKCVSPS